VCPAPLAKPAPFHTPSWRAPRTQKTRKWAACKKPTPARPHVPKSHILDFPDGLAVHERPVLGLPAAANCLVAHVAVH
jgi:hypothetical protein